MKTISLVLAILLAISGTALAQVKPPVAIKVGHIGTIADGPIYIALEKGYFKELGIELQLEKFATGGAMMAPLATGGLHIAGGAISVGFFNSLARGFPIRIVGPRARDLSLPGFSVNTVTMRADLKGEIRRPADLKGRKIAHPGPGSVTIYMMGKILETDGLTLKDVEIVYMPFGDMRVALERKAIDGMVGPEPFPTLFQEAGLAFIWARVSEFLKKEIEVASVFYYKDWAEKNPGPARDFMLAYLKGVRAFYEAATGGRNRAEVIDTLVKHTGIKDRALFDKMHWNYIDPNGVILKENIKEQQEWYVKNGMVPVRADVDAVVDESYGRYVQERLGVYRLR